MLTIPTNARTAVRVVAPGQVIIQSWTIEFLVESDDPDLVRLYSVDGDPHVIVIESNEREGALRLVCYLGQHGTERQPAGTLELQVQQDVPRPENELIFDLR